MMKIILSLMVLVSVSAIAGDLNCSMANGMLKLQDHSYSGGAAPAPGMQSSRVSWSFNDQVVFLKRSYFPCWDEMCETHEEDPSSNITWEEVADSKQILFVDGGPHTYFTRTVYGVKIKLQSSVPGQNMTGMGWESYADWFICDQMNAFYP